MGLFDFIEDVVEKTVETVVRIPEIPVRVVKGTINGVEEGIEKIIDSFDD